MVDRSTAQSDNILPPRRGAIWVQTVDATARPYQISLMPFGGKAITSPNQSDHIYLTLLCETSDVYYFFDSATGSALLDTTANAAAAAVSATTMSASTAMCARLVAGVPTNVRIERCLDQWLQIKTASGAATLRVWASSQPEV